MTLNRTGIYPGTFDPITVGHADLIARAVNIVDTLVVAVAVDNNKNNLFSIDDRVDMVKEYLPHVLDKNDLTRVKVEKFSGLLIKFASEHNSKIIFRGIRAVSDFEYEYQLACVNSRLDKNMQTIFLPASEHNQYISSRFVKEVARLSGDLSSFSCEYVINKLQDKYDN